ncbi:MAG: GMP synthase, partial [Candidatus Ordinivivax streblomastigis]
MVVTELGIVISIKPLQLRKVPLLMAVIELGMVNAVSPLHPEKVRILQEADDIFINGLHEWNLYDEVWQAGVVLLPVQSVGV